MIACVSIITMNFSDYYNDGHHVNARSTHTQQLIQVLSSLVDLTAINAQRVVVRELGSEEVNGLSELLREDSNFMYHVFNQLCSRLMRSNLPLFNVYEENSVSQLR